MTIRIVKRGAKVYPGFRRQRRGEVTPYSARRENLKVYRSFILPHGEAPTRMRNSPEPAYKTYKYANGYRSSTGAHPFLRVTLG